MLLELFIFFEIVLMLVFFGAFFTKQEILWAIAAVLSAVLMFTAFNIETYVYEYDTTLNVYSPVIISHSYPYLTGLNLLFFVLCITLGLFDIFEKYGVAISNKWRFWKK